MNYRGSIDDIKTKSQKSELFNNYRPKKEIAQKILQSVMKDCYISGAGFPLDDHANKNKIGTLSNIAGLSTILELISLDADISAYKEQFNFLIGDIFNRIYGEGNKAKFSADPYLVGNEYEVDCFVETAAKVLITMTDLRAYLLMHIDEYLDIDLKIGSEDIDTPESLLEKVEKLIEDSMQMLIDSCLPNPDPFVYKIGSVVVQKKGQNDKVMYRGWTFKQCAEEEANRYDVAIYFTYHATNAFYSFYSVFEELFTKHYEGENIIEDSEKYKDNPKLLEYDKNFFSNHLEMIEKFRACTIDSGRYIETKLKENGVDLSFDYVGRDLTPASFQSIVTSQKSNSVIDTLFVIGIYINAGLDDDYNSIGAKDDFYSLMQFSMTNIRKIYSIMRKNKAEDAISSYRIMFAEKTPSSCANLTQHLRKSCASVAVYDLVPLLCNTYSLISTYLIEYPQIEMVQNLTYIMENRNTTTEDTWYWDYEGFSVNNNLYYCFAIENFYNYYATYESPAIQNGTSYHELSEKLKKVRQSEKEKDEEIKRLKETYELELKKKDEQYEAKVSSLDSAVIELFSKTFQKMFDESITRFFEEMFDQNAALTIEVLEEMSKSPSSFRFRNFDNYDNYPKAQLLHKLSLGDKVFSTARDEYEEISALRDMDEKKTQVKRNANDAIVEEITRQIQGGN